MNSHWVLVAYWSLGAGLVVARVLWNMVEMVIYCEWEWRVRTMREAVFVLWNPRLLCRGDRVSETRSGLCGFAIYMCVCLNNTRCVFVLGKIWLMIYAGNRPLNGGITRKQWGCAIGWTDRDARMMRSRGCSASKSRRCLRTSEKHFDSDYVKKWKIRTAEKRWDTEVK